MRVASAILCHLAILLPLIVACSGQVESSGLRPEVSPDSGVPDAGKKKDGASDSGLCPPESQISIGGSCSPDGISCYDYEVTCCGDQSHYYKMGGFYCYAGAWAQTNQPDCVCEGGVKPPDAASDADADSDLDANPCPPASQIKEGESCSLNGLACYTQKVTCCGDTSYYYDLGGFQCYSGTWHKTEQPDCFCDAGGN